MVYVKYLFVLQIRQNGQPVQKNHLGYTTKPY